jgi:hypothetical protein
MLRALVIIAAVFAPALALAAPQTFDELIDLFLQLINAGIGIALISGIVIYFFGVATSIPKLKSDDPERLRAHFVWGILALFVMFSVWGILALLRNTLFGGSSSGVFDNEAGFEECVSIEDCVINE